MKNCANYNSYRKIKSMREMVNWSSHSTTNQFPKNVIKEANEQFAQIRESGVVVRKNVKKGLQGACLYYACYSNGISRTPMEIAKIIDITEKNISNGDRLLRDLNERGIITLPSGLDPAVSYINRYFELLKIDERYKQFVIDIINQFEEDKLHVIYDTKTNTKCIGAIYMLIDRIPELKQRISREKIEEECEISKNTFNKYYNMLCKFYKRFVHIFIQHRIPMKAEWKELGFGLIVKPKIRVIKRGRGGIKYYKMKDIQGPFGN
jgi:transcription initiation factor TFIIIB Brf1 subunit/transcription initiation factor TFIIB